MDLPDKSHIWRTLLSREREKKKKVTFRARFDIIYYFNHTQLQTEITSQRQTEAQITF